MWKWKNHQSMRYNNKRKATEKRAEVSMEWKLNWTRGGGINKKRVDRIRQQIYLMEYQLVLQSFCKLTTSIFWYAHFTKRFLLFLYLSFLSKRKFWYKEKLRKMHTIYARTVTQTKPNEGNIWTSIFRKINSNHIQVTWKFIRIKNLLNTHFF